MHSTRIAIASLASLVFAAAAQAAPIALNSPAATYSQSFDSLAASGTNPWANDSTINGWSLFTFGGSAPATIIASNGGSNSGSFTSYGANGDSERALGALGSGGSYFGSPASNTVAGYIAVALQNTSNVAFDSVTVGFDGEQWRNGGNTTAQTMVMEYGYGASFAGVTTWTATGFDWTSPVTGSTAAAVVGNTAGLVSGVGGTLATAWVPGDTLWLRWIERNDTGNDHGLAIDNFQVSVTAIPEPGTVALLLAGLAGVGFVVRRRRV
ncbi:MAG: PEP-CTERM sorting domain-containing protein [Rubrivivax sp.]|jgi:hypothetical protein